ncbi:thiol-disulfide oxidoreductase ResA [Bacillus gobiensis]|uniref:thiol-disulfide oxidoreductase ResA n=1 Tax=Bacillus gobiensis TaxID=1441095 RepID=UPI003D1B0F2C
MHEVKHAGHFLIKSLAAIILLLGLFYTVYSNFFMSSEKASKDHDQNNLAPDFTLQDLDGDVIRLSDFKGKAVILNFWATYCPPCDKEMPLLNKVYEEYKDKGLEILAVNAGEPRIIVSPYVNEKNLRFPILLDRTGTAVDHYDILNIPATYFINEDGVLIEKFPGELTEEKILSSLEQIIPD